MNQLIALAAQAIIAILGEVRKSGVDPAVVLAKVQTDADDELKAIITAERIARAREEAARP